MSIKLLLADDSITIQKVIGIIFGGEDYSLTVVDNGLAAVEKARELCPDVLLIDALMPGMSGYEVCEAVRAIPALATKPILILTGSFEPFDEDKAKKCGADDCLAKPFESQQIVNKVKELAELGASRAANAVVPTEPFTTSGPVAAFAAPIETIAPPEASQLTPSSDIWGAFTPDAEPSADADVPPIDAELSNSFEPDVFAIVNEESDSQLVQPATTPLSSPQQTGTQWIPVEEHTFEFEEENVADIPEAALSDKSSPEQDSVFGEIAFEEGVPAQKLPFSTTIMIDPAVSDFIAPEPENISFAEPLSPFEPEIAPLETPIPAFVTETIGFDGPVAASDAERVVTGAFSEEQLKAAISEASKEIIERIVWEVVPDLAEAMIREAIRKIKEGV